MDVKYYKSRSLWYDFKILIKTFVNVIKKDGAI